MLRQARTQFDYIFLDAPAGVDAGFYLIAQPADRFLLVTGPGPAAVRRTGGSGLQKDERYFNSKNVKRHEKDKDLFFPRIAYGGFFGLQAG